MAHTTPTLVVIFDSKDSGIPCIVFNYTVTNPTTTVMDVTLMCSQQNIGSWDSVSAITNEVERGYILYMWLCIPCTCITCIFLTHKLTRNRMAPVSPSPDDGEYPPIATCAKLTMLMNKLGQSWHFQFAFVQYYNYHDFHFHYCGRSWDTDCKSSSFDWVWLSEQEVME